MPVPYGVISTSEGPVDPEFAEAVIKLDDEKLVAAIETADAEEATTEYLTVEEAIEVIKEEDSELLERLSDE